MPNTTIEDIILAQDKRSISVLRPYLPADYCTQAAQFVMENPGTTLITTGFYILYGNGPETDGPPGALAIGKALEILGRRAVYVTDRYSSSVMEGLAGPNGEVVEFPITDSETSQRFAQDLLTRLNPALLISIERCGASRDGIYRNVRSTDISQYTAKLDYLFSNHSRTVGIGDGGNEIGMGNLAEFIPQIPPLPKDPTVTGCRHLIISSVSNWGGYGLVAAMSQLAGRNLLPSVEEEAAWVKKSVDLGAVEGVSGEAKYGVDDFTLEENSQTLARLHQLLEAGGVPAG